MTRFPLLATVLLTVLATSGTARTRDVAEQHPAAPDAQVTVVVPRGEVEIRGWDRPVLSVRGELRNGAHELNLGGPRHAPRLEVRYSDGKTDDGKAELVVMVPERCHLSVETITADVWIEDFQGAASVSSVTGSLEVGGEPQSITADLVDGDVLLAAPTDSVNISCVSGDIAVSGVRDVVRCVTFDGDINVAAGPSLRRLQVESLTGDAAIIGGLPADAVWTISLQNGDVRLGLMGDLDALFELQTLVGDLICGIEGIEDRQLTRAGTVKTLTFRAGLGRATVTANVLRGDVVVGER